MVSLAMSRLRMLLLVALPVFSIAGAGAGEFISTGGIPDRILKKNIERLVQYVVSKDLESKESGPVVTQIIGKEDLGNSKARVWFCIDREQNGRKQNACGSDVILIRLDSGRWILKDDTHGSWIVAQE